MSRKLFLTVMATLMLAGLSVFWSGSRFEDQAIQQKDTLEPQKELENLLEIAKPEKTPEIIDEPSPKTVNNKYAKMIGEKIQYYEKNPPPKIQSSDCNNLHTINRNYDENPVEFSGVDNANMQCPIRCINGNRDVSYSKGTCSGTKTWERTMENVGSFEGNDKHIAGNTQRAGDVHIQYYSWAEYAFMRPTEEKTADAALVALISNCGPQYRLDYMKKLEAAGVTLHSYGSCENNMRGKESFGGGGRLQDKVTKVIPKYKFTMSFENSNTVDYITEKMFGPLVAGSVPLYYGAPNGKIYAPNNHSAIFADDFESPEAMAKYLLELDKDDKKYKEYLTWKDEGPSIDWIMIIDSSILHSSCRYCIRSADLDRKNVGEVVTGPLQEENEIEMDKYADKVALMLKVRERNHFWLRRIHLEELTVEELRRKISEKWKNEEGKGILYAIYKLWDRQKTHITTDDQVQGLLYGEELEVLWENPGDQNRGSYTDWWNKKHGK